MKKFKDWHWITKISGPVSYSLLAVSIIAYFVLFRGDSRELISLTWGIISLVIVVVGYVLMLTSRFQLKDKFFILAKDAEYITTGLYKYVRHPIYISSSLSGFGILIFFIFFNIGALWSSISFLEEILINCVAVACQLAYTINQCERAGKEERVLRKKYGTSYEKYRATTWF